VLCKSLMSLNRFFRIYLLAHKSDNNFCIFYTKVREREALKYLVILSLLFLGLKLERFQLRAHILVLFLDPQSLSSILALQESAKF
jgi:hypothetical protein